MSEQDRVSGMLEGGMSCAEARPLLRARIGRSTDDLSGDDTILDPAFLDHLLGCGPCRAEALRAEPSLLFALAAIDPPQPDWNGFNESVLAGIEPRGRVAGLLGRLLESGIFAPKRLLPALVAAGSLAVLALIVWRTGFRQSPTPVPLTAGAAGVSDERETAGRLVAEASGAMAAVFPSPVEVIDSLTARVIQLRIGEEPQFGAPAGITGAAAGSSDFVLILDEGIDL